MSKRRNLVGEKFGLWTVLEFGEKVDKNYYWKCQCTCGRTRSVNSANLLSGNSTSCGCVPRSQVRRSRAQILRDASAGGHAKAMAGNPDSGKITLPYVSLQHKKI